jgi:hypothetical protein
MNKLHEMKAMETAWCNTRFVQISKIVKTWCRGYSNIPANYSPLSILGCSTSIVCGWLQLQPLCIPRLLRHVWQDPSHSPGREPTEKPCSQHFIITSIVPCNEDIFIGVSYQSTFSWFQNSGLQLSSKYYRKSRSANCKASH